MLSFSVLLIAIIIWGLQSKLLDKTNPIRFFVIIWVLQILLSLFFQSELRLCFWGLGYIELALVFTIFGSVIMQIYKPKEINKLRRQVKSKFALWVVAGLLILGFIQPMQVLREQGGLAVFLNINDLLEANNNLAQERYGGNGESRGTINSIFLALSYTAPLYAGYVHRAVNNIGKILSILCIFPGIFIALTQAVKMALITSVMLWIAGYATYMVYHKLTIPKMSSRLLIRILGIAGLFIGILFFSMILRTGKMDDSTIEAIQKKFILYAIGHLPTFDQWFTQIPLPNYTYGGTLFAGITNYLGLIERKQGLFQEVYQVWNDNSGMTSNIFTVFRVIIEDFGYVGSILFYFIFGSITTYMDKNLKVNRHTLISQITIMGIWAFIMWSFVTTFFAYTSYIVTLVVMSGLLYFTTTSKYREDIA